MRQVPREHFPKTLPPRSPKSEEIVRLDPAKRGSIVVGKW